MQYTPEQVSEAMELIPTLWMLKHKIKTSTGIPFDFVHRKFMWDFINDMSPLQAMLKPPQIGATESEIVKSFYVAHKKQKDIIYTLPTQSDVNEMAGGKVNRIVAQNPILKSWVKDHDTVFQKSVGSQIIYYRGTYSNKQAMMVSSDLNIHDEVDASDASVITQYETRLQSKAGGMRWYFSHPSIAGFGVDIYWQQSDKKEWYITCHLCSTEQTMQWPQNISVDRRTRICASCGVDLPDTDIEQGVWKNQDGVVWTGEIVGPYVFSGWHVSQLMCTWISADAILTAFNDPQKPEQYFYNYVLGLPFVGSDNKIMPDAVLKNVTNDVNDQTGNIIIGVDTGLPIHYVLMNKNGVFYNGKCQAPSSTYDPYVHLASYLDKWPKSIIVADQGGDLIGIRQLQAKYPGRVFLVYYRKDRKSDELAHWSDDLKTVVVDRNRMIQLIVDQMRDTGRIRLNGSIADFKTFADHFGNIYRTAKETPFGVEYVWERNGPDHFVHALLYAMVGLDRFAETAAIIVGDEWHKGIPQGRIFGEA